MDLYVEKGYSLQDCELKITQKYRRPFHILREKKIRIGGFLGLFAKDGVEVEFYFYPMSGRNSVWQPHMNWYDTTDLQKKYYNSYSNRNMSLKFEEEKKKVLVASNAALAASLPGKNPEQVFAEKTKQLLEQTKQPQSVVTPGVTPAAAMSGVMTPEDTDKKIFDSLNEIKEAIKSGGQKEEHPAFTRTRELLKLNDFSDNYTNKILERLRNELPLSLMDDIKFVENRVLQLIGESIEIYRNEDKYGKSKIMILVGPTGVGKTTTIAKLAAIFGINNSNRKSCKVRMVTIDAFRIGARAQLESYGNIMMIPVAYIDNKKDLKKEIDLFAEDTDLFLIDTIGKSPKDSAKLGEMKELLDGCRNGASGNISVSSIEVHLVLSASIKTSDIEEIIRQFEPFNYRSILLTKIDETTHLGNVISALSEKGKSISYITDGQKVPHDIKKATVMRFINRMDGFKIDQDELEKYFPDDEKDQFQWS